MAVVKRSTAVPAVFTVGRQPARPAHDPGDEPTQLFGSDEATVASVTSSDEAASAASKPAHLWAMLLGLLFAGGGAGGAYAMQQQMSVPAVEMSGQMSVWATLLVFSIVVERVLEPFTRWLPGRSAQRRFEMATVAMENGAPGAAVAAARGKADLEQARGDRTLLAWGAAVGVATAIAAASGLYLLRMVIADPSWSTVPGWADALLTGLVVGSGTKPLHDLISRRHP